MSKKLITISSLGRLGPGLTNPTASVSPHGAGGPRLVTSAQLLHPPPAWPSFPASSFPPIWRAATKVAFPSRCSDLVPRCPGMLLCCAKAAATFAGNTLTPSSQAGRREVREVPASPLLTESISPARPTKASHTVSILTLLQSSTNSTGIRPAPVLSCILDHPQGPSGQWQVMGLACQERQGDCRDTRPQAPRGLVWDLQTLPDSLQKLTC